MYENLCQLIKKSDGVYKMGGNLIRREGTGHGDWIFLCLKCASIHLQEISRWYTRTKKWYHYHHGTPFFSPCRIYWHSEWKPIDHYDRTYYYILDSLLASVFQPRDYILCHPGVDLFQILIFHRHATGSEQITFNGR